MEKERTDITKFAGRYGRIQSLMRYINLDTLKSAYHKLMEGGDEGIGAEYGRNLDENLSSLLRRMKNFSYFPQSKSCASYGNWKSKYAIRAFEDKIVQGIFGEILDAIFKPKIHRKMEDLKKKASAMRSRKLVIIAGTVIEVDVAQVLRKIDQKCLVDFLKQSVADKVFIKYCERFLRSGVKLLGECADLESESVVCFISMMCSACGYYILQSLSSSTLENDFSGTMWVAYNDKSVKIMFEKNIDCKMVCHQLDREMRKVRINVFGNKICIIRPILYRTKKYCKVGHSLRNTGRINKIALIKKQAKSNR